MKRLVCGLWVMCALALPPCAHGAAKPGTAVFYIKPSGAGGAAVMPTLKIPTHGAGHHKNAYLMFVSKAEHPKRGEKDTVVVKSAPASLPSEAAAWDVNTQLAGGVFGGKVSVVMVQDGVTTPLEEFLIRGENPRDALVEVYLVEHEGPHWYAPAIAQHESRQRRHIFNQFNSKAVGPSLRGVANYGAPDGWGIMQVDSARGAAVSTDEVYHWQHNVDAGLRVLDKARKDAAAYFNAVQRTFPAQWEPPPAAYTPPGCRTSLSALDAAVIQLYNGAAVVRRLKTAFGTYTYYRSCWAFDETAPAGRRWSFKNNTHDYVRKVIANEYEHGLGAEDE